jgi:hypothetical protein
MLIYGERSVVGRRMPQTAEIEVGRGGGVWRCG